MMKTRVIGVTVGALIGLGVGVVPDATAAPNPRSACNSFTAITADAVRVRKEPGGTILGLAWYGTPVQVRGGHGSWIHVVFPRGEFRESWVFGEYVNRC
jgi:hypothetical protein